MVLKLPSHTQYYDIRKGFVNDKPNWHLIKILNNDSGYLEFHESCLEMIDWLYTELDMPERHCRWHYDCDKIEVKFRYIKHYNWFTLRWC